MGRLWRTALWLLAMTVLTGLIVGVVSALWAVLA